MFWYFVFGGAAAAAIFALLRGHNPLIWFFTSVPGVPLLTLMPPANGKALGEQKRARREVGNKVGMMAGGVVVLVAIILAIIGI